MTLIRIAFLLGLFALAVLNPQLHTGPIDMAIAPWVIPAIMGAIGLGGQLFGGGGGNRTIYEQGHPLWPGSEPSNKQLWEQIMGYPWGGTPPGVGGGGGGGSSSMSSTNSVTNMNGRTISDVTQTPFLTPEYEGLGKSMRDILAGRLSSGSGLPYGYEQNRIKDINDSYGSMRTALANRLSNMGMAGSPGPTEAGYGYIEANRGRDLSNLKGELPLLDRQLQDSDINMASQLAATFGLGQKQHTDTTTQQKSTTNTNSQSSSSGGGGGGGAVPTGPALLPQAYYEAHAPQQQGGGFLDSLGGILGLLYATGVFDTKGGGKTASTGGANYPGYGNAMSRPTLPPLFNSGPLIPIIPSRNFPIY